MRPSCCGCSRNCSRNCRKSAISDKPKLVFFFDEAHLLFADAPKALLEKIEQVVRLIRSKGVGVYFVTQNPLDVPDKVLAQLGNRVQHALRAYTPREQKAVKTAAETFRPNPKLDTAQVITELGKGEALVSFLEGNGVPSMVERAHDPSAERAHRPGHRRRAQGRSSRRARSRENTTRRSTASPRSRNCRSASTRKRRPPVRPAAMPKRPRRRRHRRLARRHFRHQPQARRAADHGPDGRARSRPLRHDPRRRAGGVGDLASRWAAARSAAPSAAPSSAATLGGILRR